MLYSCEEVNGPQKLTIYICIKARKSSLEHYSNKLHTASQGTAGMKEVMYLWHYLSVRYSSSGHLYKLPIKIILLFFSVPQALNYHYLTWNLTESSRELQFETQVSADSTVISSLCTSYKVHNGL